MNQTSTQTERRGPPMPRFLMKVVNPLLKMVLNSPFHGKISHELMVLRWTGRKSGKRYATPVGYVYHEKHIYVFTHSQWYKNFTSSAPVTMHIAGKDVPGMARKVNDPAEIKHMIQILVKTHGKERAQQMGFWVDDLDQSAPETVAQAVRGTYFIRIDV